MKQYIKVTMLAAFLIAISPLANAKVINLYDMEDYEFFGSKKLTDKKDLSLLHLQATQTPLSQKLKLTL